MSRQRGSRTQLRRRLPRRLGLLALAVVLLTALGGLVVPNHAVASSHCAVPRADTRAGETTTCTVVVAGQARSYLLSVPPDAVRPAPLVVAFHGLFQTVDGFANQTGLIPATRSAGLVLALPESEGPAFNDSRLGHQGPADDAFTMALVGQLVEVGVADPHRVLVTGFSNGAGMAMAVASAHPRAVAAVVSIDGSLIDAPGAPRPTGAVRAVLVHGTEDRVQPWGGRPAKGQMLPAYLPVPETVDHWVKAAGASPATLVHLTGPRAVEVSKWSSGRVPVESYTIAGMGHEWPVASRDTVNATALITQVATALTAPTAAKATSRSGRIAVGAVSLSRR